MGDEISISRERAILRVAFRSAMAFALMACSTKSSQADAPVDDAGSGSGSGPSAPDASVDADAAASRCDPVIFNPDPPDTCGDYVRLACGLPSGVVPRDNCYLTLNDCAALCPDIQFNCRVIDSYCLDGGTPVPDEAGAMVLDCAICPSGSGRMPAGLAAAASPAAGSLLGRRFARAAHFEAASIHAFRTLRRELALHGAPASLVRATHAAARDEVRHARVMARLARRHGADWARPSVDPPPSRTRSLEAVATENLVEGCVRETFGGLVVAAEAKRSEDPEVAEALGTIADDELAHAALSWAVQRWADAQLDADARTRMRMAARAAIESLRITARREASAGLSATERVRFVDGLKTTVWSALFEV